MTESFGPFRALVAEWIERARSDEVRQIYEIVTAEMRRRGDTPPCEGKTTQDK